MEGADDVVPLVGGRDFPGDLDRYYHVVDGRIRIGALEGTTPGDVRTALGAPESATLDEVLVTKPQAKALSLLHEAGVPAAAARLARELVLSGNPYLDYSRTPHEQDVRPPGGGEHSQELLPELGMH